MIPKSFDILGNIAILKFDKSEKKRSKISSAEELMNRHKNITSVLEKSGKIKGRLRTFKTNYLAGEKTKVALYKENNCLFRFDVEKTYFSPRLSNERAEIAKQVKKNENVLVLFAGVAPFSIVIAKNAKPKKIVSVEINREASKFAQENVKLNKLNNIEIIQGDVKKIIPRLAGKKISFDRIVMPRPQLKDTFLEYAFKVSKKDTIINYYGFSKEPDEIISQIKEQAEKSGKKIKINSVKKAGDVAPFRYRWRIDFKVLS